MLAPGASQGWITTPPIEVPQGFRRAIPSWNLLQAEGSSYRIEFRARNANGCWSSWFSSEPSMPSQNERTGTRIRWDIDQLLSEDTLTAFQLNVHLSRESVRQSSPALRTLYLASMRPSRSGSDVPVKAPEPVTPIPLPFVYQHDLDSRIGGQICSPTSVTMVLQGAGIQVAPLEVARWAFHPKHGIYGVWPLAVHAAYQLGMKGWVQFINGWPQAVRYLKKGIPMVASIAFSEGELKEPPYPPTEGHLLVLLGVDDQGRPITHDPHLPEERGAFLRWNPEDFSKAWFGHGGVAYVFPSRRK